MLNGTSVLSAIVETFCNAVSYSIAFFTGPAYTFAAIAPIVPIVPANCSLVFPISAVICCCFSRSPCNLSCDAFSFSYDFCSFSFDFPRLSVSTPADCNSAFKLLNFCSCSPILALVLCIWFSFDFSLLFKLSYFFSVACSSVDSLSYSSTSPFALAVSIACSKAFFFSAVRCNCCCNFWCSVFNSDSFALFLSIALFVFVKASIFP